MVNAAEADVVGPAVAAHHPHAGPGEEVPQSPHLLELRWQRLRIGLQLQKPLQSVAHNLADLLVVLLLQPLHQGALHLGRAHASLDGSLDALGDVQPALVHGEHHPQAVLCVVLEQAVAPRHATAGLLVHSVGDPARSRTPNAAAPGGVREDHALPEELRQQLGIWSLPATLASSAELEEWLIKLGTLHRERVKALTARGQRHREVPSILVALLHGSMDVLHC
mmetsp:Transcript_65363/g.169847  ORF Transcript_65363/g.169847 Transcript_65363/m.169847 type:complete len:223 (+) Transcript_65363:223-891(+)